MILDLLAPVGNHLWQSTIFAIGAALLTLALRRNQARVRYGLWLAASLKFLIPFSLLISLGGHLARPHGAAEVQSGLYSVVEEAGQPFTQAATPAITPVTHTASVMHLLSLLPEILAAVWLCGFVAVLGLWWLRWRRVASAVRGSTPMSQGREVDALRKLERIAGVRKPIAFLLSRDSLEPGIFGIIRPVLVWPAGISERLDNAHLEAILAHEIWHVRRRDNLAAATQMVVEAIFWFYPLVWWLGTRMVEEREHACDEAVLQFANEPQVYAESILKVCEFCVGSPLACVSGVTGADLKKRIVDIMMRPILSKLSIGRKLMLAVITLGTVTVPVLFGFVTIHEFHAQLLPMPSGPIPSFEVASVRPSGPNDPHQSIGMRPGTFATKSTPLKEIIKFAYNIKSDDELERAPSWISSERYDIDAKEDAATLQKLNQLPPNQRVDQVRLMVQSLLTERFQLKVSRRTEELPVYALVVAKNGPKLTQALPAKSTDVEAPAPPTVPRSYIMMERGSLTGKSVPVTLLAEVLAQQPETGDRVVLDETGLKRSYDWSLKWAPDSQFPAAASTAPPPVEYPKITPARGSQAPSSNEAANSHQESSGPSLFTAIQEQLGLKLVPQKGAVEVLVIDHVERPSAN